MPAWRCSEMADEIPSLEKPWRCLDCGNCYSHRGRTVPEDCPDPEGREKCDIRKDFPAQSAADHRDDASVEEIGAVTAMQSPLVQAAADEESLPDFSAYAEMQDVADLASSDISGAEHDLSTQSADAAREQPPRDSERAVFHSAGDIIGKRFKILKILEDRGNQADPYVALEITTGKRVFVKKLRASPKDVAAQKEKKAELKTALMSIEHHGCVRYLDILILEKDVYDILEFVTSDTDPDVSAPTLRNMIENPVMLPILQGRLDEFIRQMSQAIAYLHGHDLVHRDLKPENILVPSLDPLRFVITDYGAITQIDSGVTQVVRTPIYSPPESLSKYQKKSRETQGHDWWALGRMVQEIHDGEDVYHQFFRSVSVDADDDRSQVPFEYWLEETLNERKFVHRAGMVENFEGSDPIRKLLRGLLTTSVEHRWSGEQVSHWLDGQEVPDYYDHRTYDETSRGSKLFEFDGRKLSLAQAAEVLSQPENFARASEQIRDKGNIISFIRYDLGNELLDTQIKQIRQIIPDPDKNDGKSDPERKAADDFAVWLALWAMARSDGGVFDLREISLKKLRVDATSGEEAYVARFIEMVRLSAHPAVRAAFEVEVDTVRVEGPPPEITELQEWHRGATDPSLVRALQIIDEDEEGMAIRLALLRQLAEEGHSYSAWRLFNIYYRGKAVRADVEEASKFYEQARNQGHPEARLPLAEMQFEIAKEFLAGSGLDEDIQFAEKLLRLAAQRGYAEAQNLLGRIYSDGLGVPKDYPQAVNWYRKAAEQGHAMAQRNLGYMYANGFGEAQDSDQAINWYRKAAEQGNADAQCNLASCYAAGRMVAKDERKALDLFRKAAEQGNALAQNNLGWMYAHGLGVDQPDEQEAFYWYSEAVKQGYEQAKKNLLVLQQRAGGAASNQPPPRNRQTAKSGAGATRGTQSATPGAGPLRSFTRNLGQDCLFGFLTCFGLFWVTIVWSLICGFLLEAFFKLMGREAFPYNLISAYYEKIFGPLLIYVGSALREGSGALWNLGKISSTNLDYLIAPLFFVVGLIIPLKLIGQTVRHAARSSAMQTTIVGSLFILYMGPMLIGVAWALLSWVFGWLAAPSGA